MTYRELYLQTKHRLCSAGVDSFAEDSMALLEHFFGIDRTGLALHGDDCPNSQAEADFLRAAAERENRRPLQYILGTWDFMWLRLSVGEGVLVPREDTGILVEAVASELKNIPCPIGADLCAGTGAVALGVCSLLPGARITCIELSDNAIPYLQKNIAAHRQFDVRAAKGDILQPEATRLFAEKSLDFIASNPPYIKSQELAALQEEVQKEPCMALDGGSDGLIFYRAIARLWLPLIKPGGVLAVEIGEDQGNEVSGLFRAHDLEDVRVLKDWAGLDRCVIGKVTR